MVAVSQWTGVEIRALLVADRCTHAELAASLGVTERQIEKWLNQERIVVPRAVNQRALDTVLERTAPDARQRFIQQTMGLASIMYDDADVALVAAAAKHPIRRHRIDGRPMTVVNQGVYLGGAGNQPEWLSGYWIDVYPVTNADYGRFVEATGHRPPPYWENGVTPAQLATHPVVFVTWYDSHAYASWAGKSLPTAQQWEKAARGPKGAIYPWGDQLTPFKCNVRESRVGQTTPVDRYHSGVSAYGVYDLCGNTWEWCSSSTSAGRFELKGSAFTSPFARATPSAFNDALGAMSDDDTGFRCVAVDERDLMY
jgi:DNA-binding transcriptional regulator YiaG